MASQFIFDAIGTRWTIDIYNSLSKEKEKTLLAQITERIGVFDKTYSRFRADSLVTTISKTKGRYILPDDALPMFTLYRTLYEVTAGLVTPLIGQVLSDAGYDAAYSLVPHRPLQSPPAWDEAMGYEHPHLDVHLPVLLDFGALGKGYLIDLVGRILEDEGVDSFCIDAGGDMLYKNVTGVPLVVGLEHPEDTDKVVGTVSILNQSLCGSAGNRRVWKDFHHIINPQTRVSPRHILAIWVISADTITADGLTTALFFISPDVLERHFAFEYFILYPDYSFEKSAGFAAKVFSSEL